MVTLDFRTRTDDDIAAVETRAFFEEQLPELVAKHAHFAVPGARELGVAPFSFVTPSGEWTLAVAGDTFTIERGADGVAAVRLSDADVADVVNDLKTPMTFLTGGTARHAARQPRQLPRLVGRVALAHRRAPGAHTRCGRLPRPRRRAARPPPLVRARRRRRRPRALPRAKPGSCTSRGWFDADEMAAIDADMDAALPTYAPRRRQLVVGADRRRRRPLRAHAVVPASTPRRPRALLASDRFLRIGRLTDDDFRTRERGNQIEALVKPIGVVEGISDVPWHKDCSLGMHSYRCCGAHRRHLGDRRRRRAPASCAVVAGSHRALVQPAFVRSRVRPPDRRPPDRDRRRHRPLLLHAAHVATAGRARAARRVHRVRARGARDGG